MRTRTPIALAAATALAALGTSGCGSLSDEDDLNTRPSWLGSVSAASYDGSSPCLRDGLSWTLVRSTSRAWISRGRVSRGSMTSSIWPTSAAW